MHRRNTRSRTPQLLGEEVIGRKILFVLQVALLSWIVGGYKKAAQLSRRLYSSMHVVASSLTLSRSKSQTLVKLCRCDIHAETNFVQRRLNPSVGKNVCK